MAKTAKLLGDNLNPAFRYLHDVADVQAVQAWSQGRATPDQQLRAFNWVLTHAAQTYDQSFHPESDRLTSFMEGRRFVGTKLVLFANANIQRLKKKQDPTTPPSEHGD